MLIMIRPNGDLDEIHRQELRPGDDADAIARVLTRRVRRQMLGISEDNENFGRPLRYAAAGVA